MEDLESLLWITAILSAAGIIAVIAKDYIDGYRMEKKIEGQHEEMIRQLHNATYVIDTLNQKISKQYPVLTDSDSTQTD
tara:strand:- start:7289 stop:7525 length:237 start_codon:yes stop_codon:yes gene_type:complete